MITTLLDFYCDNTINFMSPFVLIFCLLYKKMFGVFFAALQSEMIAGTTKFDALALDACKSSLIFELIEEERTPSEASVQSLLSCLRGLDDGYNRYLNTFNPLTAVSRGSGYKFFVTLYGEPAIRIEHYMQKRAVSRRSG